MRPSRMAADSTPTGYIEHARSHWEGSAHTPLPRRLDLIETLWTVRADAPRDFLVLPDGRADLIVWCRITENGTCDGVTPMVVGPSSLHHHVDLMPRDGFVGVRLRPGRLGVLGEAAALADKRLVGADAVGYVPALSALPGHAPSFKAMVAAMRCLAATLPTPKPISLVEAALDRTHLAGGRVEPHSIASALGIGPRRLHRLFARQVGLSPQLYASVIRFQRAVRLRRRGLTIGAVAHEAGYSDQSHMTRAFRRHGGFTPAKMPDAALGWLPVQ